MLALATVAALLAVSCYLTGIFRILSQLAAAGVLLSLLLSLAATWIADDASRLYQFSWLAPPLSGAEHGANLNAGFDETTALLRISLPSIAWQVFDFHDPAAHTEASIRRARRAHPPEPGTVSFRNNPFITTFVPALVRQTLRNLHAPAFLAVLDLSDRPVPLGVFSEPLKIHPFQAVFFIAKPGQASSIPDMIPRLMLIAVSSVLALALTSCCCLF